MKYSQEQTLWGMKMSDVEGAAPEETAPEGTEADFAWKEHVPEFARNWDEVKNAESFGDFMSWADNARSLVGQSVRVPSEEAGQDDWDAFSAKLLEKNANVMMKPRNAEEVAAAMKALGRPDESAAYNFEVEGYQPDTDRLASMKQMAHDANMTTDQFNSFMSGMAKAELEAGQAQALSQTESMNGLRQEWGAAFDQNVNQVQNFLSRMDAPASFRNAERDGLFDSGDYKFLHDLSERVGGEGSPGAGNSGETHVMTPADAKARIAEIRANKEHAYHRGDQEAMEQMLTLQRMSTGSGSVTPFSSTGT